ncbi:MAG: UvrB/UvrC motif-containing protein [Akkermansiaceae bacterium]
MKCDYCDSKATVFLTQLAEGQMKKVCLCDACANERGVTDPTGFSLADMLLGNFQKEIGDSANSQNSENFSGDANACPQCGFTFEDFQKVRRFGCANCYKVFRKELTPTLKSMHKGSTHTGKIPEGLMESHLRLQKLEDLNTRLAEAIESESYEEAAKIRDEIHDLDEEGVEK